MHLISIKDLKSESIKSPIEIAKIPLFSDVLYNDKVESIFIYMKIICTIQSE